jgi:hypothetical protein
LSVFEQISLLNNLNAFLITNMWQVYTRPTSASYFFHFEVSDVKYLQQISILRIQNLRIKCIKLVRKLQKQNFYLSRYLKWQKKNRYRFHPRWKTFSLNYIRTHYLKSVLFFINWFLGSCSFYRFLTECLLTEMLVGRTTLKGKFIWPKKNLNLPNLL